MDTGGPAERSWFSQSGYPCRLDWGRSGARDAAARGDVLVVVDVLTFSTAVATAAARGVLVYPSLPANAHDLAARLAAEVAVRREDVPRLGRLSLSPLTYLDATPGTRVVLGSPNGAACCLLGRGCAAVAVAGLVNARATAAFVATTMERTGAAVTVLACAERRPEGEDGPLRWAVEDYLGAGAVLSHLGVDRSPEAVVCEAAFRAVAGRLEEVLLGCGSGVELVARGHAEDVRHAARLDLIGTAVVMQSDGSLAPPSDAR